MKRKRTLEDVQAAWEVKAAMRDRLIIETCDACDGSGIESDPDDIDLLWPDERCHVCSGRGVVRSTDDDDAEAAR